ncbi:unnamed protein product [Trifolium pratense]|uniref:Uncharacterized protein n=1 Tax=Trifolium pratense TaxID=57577 RepID=A0ACB0INS8_TRIPR|nr:unnamed protein product [Trifolium pratense]
MVRSKADRSTVRRRTCSSQINRRSSFRLDCQGHNQNPPTWSVGSADQWPFGFILCQPNHIISPAGAQLGQHQLAYQHIQQQQQLQAFWANQ